VRSIQRARRFDRHLSPAEIGRADRCFVAREQRQAHPDGDRSQDRGSPNFAYTLPGGSPWAISIIGSVLLSIINSSLLLPHDQRLRPSVSALMRHDAQVRVRPHLSHQRCLDLKVSKPAKNPTRRAATTLNATILNPRSEMSLSIFSPAEG
jgi:hypothetical protein